MLVRIYITLGDGRSDVVRLVVGGVRREVIFFVFVVRTLFIFTGSVLVFQAKNGFKEHGYIDRLCID